MGTGRQSLTSREATSLAVGRGGPRPRCWRSVRDAGVNWHSNLELSGYQGPFLYSTVRVHYTLTVRGGRVRRVVEGIAADPLQGFQLHVVQEVLLALLAAEPSNGYRLRARLALALGPLADALSEGQVYVTLGRLEKAGLVSVRHVSEPDGPRQKVYEVSPSGGERVLAWLNDVTWPKPAPAEFHLKLVAAAAAGLADPNRIVERQRETLLLGLRSAQRARLAEPDGSVAGLLLEGVVLRLQADLRWLEECVRYWKSASAR